LKNIEEGVIEYTTWKFVFFSKIK